MSKIISVPTGTRGAGALYQTLSLLAPQYEDATKIYCRSDTSFTSGTFNSFKIFKYNSLGNKRSKQLLTCDNDLVYYSTAETLPLCAIDKNIQSSDTTISDFSWYQQQCYVTNGDNSQLPETQLLSVAQNCIHGLDEADEDDQWLSGVVFDPTCPVN